MFMFGLNDVAGSGGAAVAAQTAINDGMVHPNSKTLDTIRMCSIYRYYTYVEDRVRREKDFYHGKRWTSTIGDNDVQHSLSITLI